jgi:hypothetical protein
VLTFKRVFAALFVLAFARELIGAALWAEPVTIGLATAPAVRALVSRLLAVATTAAMVYLALRAAAALRQRWARRARER